MFKDLLIPAVAVVFENLNLKAQFWTHLPNLVAKDYSTLFFSTLSDKCMTRNAVAQNI
jgi:hypothetical protein